MAGPSLVIVGAGGFSREVICWAEDAHRANLVPPIRGYLVDPQYSRLGAEYDLPWLGGLDDYVPRAGDYCILAVSDPVIKRPFVQRLLARDATFANLVHPSAVVARTATLGLGCVVCPFALVSANVVVGDYVTINAMSSIGHDSTVGRFSTLSGHVDITGGVSVGDSVFFGTGARVLPRLSVGEAAKVGAGAVVMRSVAAGTTVYTNPARKLC